MALGLEEMKLYLRIDDVEEDTLIESLIEYSVEEMEDSTGADIATYGDTKTYQLLQKIIVTDRFENRGSTEVDFKANNIYSSICTKLKAKVESDGE